LNNFTEQLIQANASIDSLHSVLESEFSALSEQALDQFQQLQEQKLGLLQQIKAFDGQKRQFLSNCGSTHPDNANLEAYLSPNQQQLWSHFLQQLKACDELHRKVDLYLNQKLKTANEVLEILQVSASHSATKLYDEFGTSKLSTIGNKISEA